MINACLFIPSRVPLTTSGAITSWTREPCLLRRNEPCRMAPLRALVVATTLLASNAFAPGSWSGRRDRTWATAVAAKAGKGKGKATAGGGGFGAPPPPAPSPKSEADAASLASKTANTAVTTEKTKLTAVELGGGHAVSVNLPTLDAEVGDAKVRDKNLYLKDYGEAGAGARLPPLVLPAPTPSLAPTRNQRSSSARATSCGRAQWRLRAW